MKIICKFLCWLGIHQIDEDEWGDREDDDGDLFLVNYCKRCGKVIEKYD